MREDAFASKAPSRALPKTGWDKSLNLFLFSIRPRLEKTMNGRFLPNLGANAFASKVPFRVVPKTGWDKSLNYSYSQYAPDWKKRWMIVFFPIWGGCFCVKSALPKTGWDKGLNLFLFPMRPKQISIPRYIWARGPFFQKKKGPLMLSKESCLG